MVDVALVLRRDAPSGFMLAIGIPANARVSSRNTAVKVRDVGEIVLDFFGGMKKGLFLAILKVGGLAKAGTGYENLQSIGKVSQMYWISGNARPVKFGTRDQGHDL